MKLSVVPTEKFNKEKFATLLQKARGNIKKVEFARNCGVSLSTMSNYLNQKNEKAPSLSIIRKITDYTSQFGLKYEDLAQAAGYAPKDIGIDKTNLDKRYEKYIEQVKTTIIYALSRTSLSWNQLSNTNELLKISINSSTISEWNFCLFPPISGPCLAGPIVIPSSFYGSIIGHPMKKNAKISIVTDNAMVYKQLIEYNPYMLALYVSIILVDLKNISIIEEKYVKTYFDIDEDVQRCALH